MRMDSFIRIVINCHSSPIFSFCPSYVKCFFSFSHVWRRQFRHTENSICTCQSLPAPTSAAVVRTTAMVLFRWRGHSWGKMRRNSLLASPLRIHKETPVPSRLPAKKPPRPSNDIVHCSSAPMLIRTFSRGDADDIHATRPKKQDVLFSFRKHNVILTQ